MNFIKVYLCMAKKVPHLLKYVLTEHVTCSQSNSCYVIYIQYKVFDKCMPYCT